jgi:hypothetical protein
VLQDGTTLPVHGLLLCTISPVLAGLATTKSPAGGRFAVEISVEMGQNTAGAFLLWLYHQKVEWTLPLAKGFARLSHYWNIPGEILVTTMRLCISRICTTLQAKAFLNYWQSDMTIFDAEYGE